MEQEYKIISVLGNDTKVVEMNDKSGFTFVYPDGKISSGRYGEIGKFDETGYATIKRVGESEVCALLDKDGNIYTKKVLGSAGVYESNLDKAIANDDYARTLRKQVDKNGCIKTF